LLTRSGLSDATLTVLLVDDIESQADRIQECLAPYGIRVEWRPSYRTAIELLRDPDGGQLVDLVLVDQAFDVEAVDPADLLTPSEVETVAGTEEWDVRLHQGLFIVARLNQDMREGLIPFVPTTILTHHGRVGIALQTVGLCGYQSKRRLLADPYGALKGMLAQVRPRPEDVDRRLERLAARLGLEAKLAGQVRERVMDGLDLEDACLLLSDLRDPNDWTAVARALDRLAEDRRPFTAERMATAVEGAWLPSPEGWRRICHVEAVAAVDHGFDVFRVRIGRNGVTFPAILAARALLAESAPSVGALRRSFQLLRAIDGRSRPVRLKHGRWTILGCWQPEPVQPGGGARAAAQRLLEVTRHLRDLHRRGLAHGSLTVTSAAYEQPVLGGIRCLAGDQDFAALRGDDLRQLPVLAAATFGEEPPDETRRALDRWCASVARGDLDEAERVLEAANLHGEPPAYFDFDRLLYSGGEGAFRDLLLASLGEGDAVLREVPCAGVSSHPLDFVVCAGGTLAVLEHRAGRNRVVLSDGDIASVETDPPTVARWRWRRSLNRCRRSAGALAERVESGLGLPPNSIRRLSAIVVGEGTDLEAPAGTAWRHVVTEAEAVAELSRLSRRDGAPRGVDMARFLPRPQGRQVPQPGVYRGLHWLTVPLDGGGSRLRTWRKQWPPAAWGSLLANLATARDAFARLPERPLPLPLVALAAYDDDGGSRDIGSEAAVVDLVEYDVQVPASATALAGYYAPRASETGGRALAAEVLRSLLAWERVGLAYRTMGPDGLLHADGHVYCDLLQSVVPIDAESRWRQRRGAAACLVLLLAPWPYAWPAVLSGALPVPPDPPDECSAWGIGATAVAALLDREGEPGRISERLSETAELLDAAARLDRRFPAWPSRLAQEAYR